MSNQKEQAAETLLSPHETNSFNQINKIHTLDSLEISNNDRSETMSGMNNMQLT